jgi:hypothetical protein
LSQISVLRGGSEKGVAASWARFLRSDRDIQPGAQGRVVNTWFAHDGERTISPTCALGANRRYLLGVNIGQPDREKTNIRGDQPELPPRLIDYLIGAGEPLILRVDSEDFYVVDREQVLLLPPAGTTQDIYLRIVTPVSTGLGRLRLGVYFKNNLVQSYLVYARVAPVEGEMPNELPEEARDGWWSECEYTLSADFANLADLRSRRVCVWMGEGKEEMRRARVSASTGLNMGPAVEVNAPLIRSSLARYRELLYQSCVKKNGEDQVEYLYGADHAPLDPWTFESNLIQLADLGRMLYGRLFGTVDGRQVAENMREIERTQGEEGPLVVQIARLSLDATFPWAVLYDRQLHYNPSKTRGCPAFLGGEDCAAQCAYEDDPNVVCPYGFWGYRYIIEQPLRPPHAYTSVATQLQYLDRPRLALVYGTGLGLTKRHRQQVETVLGDRADAIVYSATATLLKEIKGDPAVVYFYCHGGNTPYQQWLVIRDDDLLTPMHLDDDLYAAWSDGAPLVVLNGCHTGKYDPATLLSFIHRFGALGAAGVIGTEIPIHEYLGSDFGLFLFRRLLAGEPVGQIVYDFRQELLKKQNLLGLVYVPYCYADLRIVEAKV